MPVILDNGSEELRTWLNPAQSTWSKELQGLLKPYEGDLEVYPVSKEVGKVGNNSPNFIIPVASSENRSNIANFFAKGATKENLNTSTATTQNTNISASVAREAKSTLQEQKEDRETVDHEGTEDNAPMPVPKGEVKKGIKRELEDVTTEEPPSKILKTSNSPTKPSPAKPTAKSRSATTNVKLSPKKPVGQEKGTQKITNFFSK
jgi:hypothetical protein